MRIILMLLAAGAAAYALLKGRAQELSHSHTPKDANGMSTGPVRVRDAGPKAMRDKPRRAWTEVDEASDQSFPASDPPGNY